MTKNKKRVLYNYCVAVASKGLYNMDNETPPTFEEWDRHLTRCEENRVDNNINIRDFIEQEIFLFEQDALGDGRKDLIYKLADSINNWFIINEYGQGVYLEINKLQVPHIKLLENISVLSYIVIVAIIDAYYNWRCPELHEQLHD